MCQIYISWPSDEYIAFASPKAMNAIDRNFAKLEPILNIDTYLFGARELDISIYPWFALIIFHAESSHIDSNVQIKIVAM